MLSSNKPKRAIVERDKYKKGKNEKEREHFDSLTLGKVT